MHIVSFYFLQVHIGNVCVYVSICWLWVTVRNRADCSSREWWWIRVNCCCNGAHVKQWHWTRHIVYFWHFRVMFENNAQTAVLVLNDFSQLSFIKKAGCLVWVLGHIAILHRVWKKWNQSIFASNFARCWSVFKIISPIDIAVNFRKASDDVNVTCSFQVCRQQNNNAIFCRR